MAPACPGKSPVAPALGHVVYVCSVAAGQNLTFFRFKSPLGHHDTGCIPLHLIAPAGSQDPGRRASRSCPPRCATRTADAPSRVLRQGGRVLQDSLDDRSRQRARLSASARGQVRVGGSGEPSAARREYRSARLAVREPCLTRRPDDIRGCGDVRCRPSGRRTRRCRGTCPSVESRGAYDAPTQRALRRPSRYVGFIVNRP